MRDTRIPSKPSAGGTHSTLTATTHCAEVFEDATSRECQSNEDLTLPAPIAMSIPEIDAISPFAASVPALGSDFSLLFEDEASLSDLEQRSSSPLFSRPRKKAHLRAPSDPAELPLPLLDLPLGIIEDSAIIQDEANDSEFRLWTTGIFDPPTPRDDYVESFSDQDADYAVAKPLDQNVNLILISKDQEDSFLLPAFVILLSNPALLLAFGLLLKFPYAIQTMQSFYIGISNITKRANHFGNPDTYNLPDEDPIFAKIVPLVPLRYRDFDSRVITTICKNRADLTDEIYFKPGVHTMPPSTSYLGVASGIHPSIPSYPLPLFDHHRRRLHIDNEKYYKGKYAKAVQLACFKFWGVLITEIPLPEMFESIDVIFWWVMSLLFQCVKDAFDELNFVSYEDKVFRMVHIYGLVLVVWGSRVDLRNDIKLATRAAVLQILQFCLTDKVLEDKTETTNHKDKCIAKSFMYIQNRSYVNPIGPEIIVLCDYTNGLFFHAIMKVLFLDDKKFGRTFRAYFKDTIHIPTVAFFATSFLNTFQEFVMTRTLKNVDFAPERYDPEFRYHLSRIYSLLASETYGPLLRATLARWAAVGCSCSHNGRGTVNQLKADLKMAEMHEMMGQPMLQEFCSFSPY